jgi:hypothetical protein
VLKIILPSEIDYSDFFLASFSMCEIGKKAKKNRRRKEKMLSLDNSEFFVNYYDVDTDALVLRVMNLANKVEAALWDQFGTETYSLLI